MMQLSHQLPPLTRLYRTPDLRRMAGLLGQHDEADPVRPADQEGRSAALAPCPRLRPQHHERGRHARDYASWYVWQRRTGSGVLWHYRFRV